MLTVRLTKTKFTVLLMAARAISGNDDIQIGFESEPTAEVGDEIEIIVDEDTPQYARVLAKLPPTHEPPHLRGHQLISEAAMQDLFRQQTGVVAPVERFRGDPAEEAFQADLRAEQWYLVVRKSRA